MGSFFLITKTQDPNWVAHSAAAMEVFSQAGLTRPELIDDQTYFIAAFPTRQEDRPTLERFPSGDFILLCGTLFYRGLTGKAAAIEFHHDYRTSSGPSSEAMGHYAIILRKGETTEIIPDSFGGFQVFLDDRMRIAASSFLAVAATPTQLSFSAYAAYEYVFNGVVSGNATLFDEITLVPVNSTLRLRPRSQSLEVVRHPFQLPTAVSAEPFERSINRSLDILDNYFSMVASNFGDRVTTALSGGYDSRLILALLRRHGVRPRLYVYGPPGDRDIAVARVAAEGEGLPLEIIDKDNGPIVDLDEFQSVAHQNFLNDDGYSWTGIFHDGAERRESVKRVSGNAIALNGGGGEIWRNFFYLPDRSYSPRAILWSFYAQFDPHSCTSAFDQEEYFSQLENKITALIGVQCDELPRPLIEWLYHNFRCRAWDGRVNTINNTYGHAALPFLERPLTEHASAIPMRWKNHGAYEAELIRRTDPHIARYPSVYGHDFRGPPPLSRILSDYATYLRPPWLRRFSYRVKHRIRRQAEWPRYLRQPYVAALLPDGLQVMSGLFLLRQTDDPQQVARILTLEYVVRQFGGRVRYDFGSKIAGDSNKCAA